MGYLKRGGLANGEAFLRANFWIIWESWSERKGVCFFVGQERLITK